jgi:endonuclease III
MNRYVSEQLMTVEEAMRLSQLDGSYHNEKAEQRKHIWAWQNVSGVLSQTVSDEQVDQAMKTLRKR